MATVNVPVPPSRSPAAAPAPSSAYTLENGDRLTRGEFERRYEARPDIKKAELIEGVVLADGAYRPHQPDAAGLIHSRVFPGLRMAVEAMLRSDLVTVLRALQHGLGSDAHRAFAARLAGRSPSGETAEWLAPGAPFLSWNGPCLPSSPDVSASCPAIPASPDGSASCPAILAASAPRCGPDFRFPDS
ncbi:MAG: hypothetical protein OXF93_09935 [Acidobacteria bacterium]|nr:hypothetical protein [Acidobacteriota bacterium]